MREREVVAEQAYAWVLYFGMVLDVAITPEMWSLRRLDSLMQRDLARNFARVVVLKSPQRTTFYTYAPDVHDAWLALSTLWT